MKQKTKELLERVTDAGVNIVTCGECGKALLHDITDELIQCPHCKIESDPCDFPDLFF